jgi:RecA-family ATPase
MTPAEVIAAERRQGPANGIPTVALVDPGHEPFGEGPDDGPASKQRTAEWADRPIEAPVAWFTTPAPKRDWLLRDGRTALGAGVLPLGKVGMILADSGVGKTQSVLGLSLAVALGDAWLGAFFAPVAGRSLLVLGEEDAEEVHRRFYNVVRATHAKAPPEGAIVVLPLAGVPCPMIEVDPQGNSYDAPFLVWLRAYVVERGPFALIVVDPLSRFAGAAAETDNAAATRFVQALESIASSTGATVIVVHHTNKGARANGAGVTSASARGSSAFVDGVRWAAALSSERVQCADAETSLRLGEIVTFAVVKSNYARKAEPVLLRRDANNGGALLPLDATDMETVVAARAGAEPAARRRAQREEQGKARAATVAEAIVAVLGAHPEGLSYRGLRGKVKNRVTCSDAVLGAALQSLGPRLRKSPGRDRSTLHFLAPGEA